MSEQDSTGPIPLGGSVTLRLRDGSLVKIMPGPYGKGITVLALPAPQAGKVPRGKPTGTPRGRKPHPGTVALRRRLKEDSLRGDLQAPGDYLKWLLELDPGIGRPVAWAVVCRELKPYRRAGPDLQVASAADLPVDSTGK